MIPVGHRGYYHAPGSKRARAIVKKARDANRFDLEARGVDFGETQHVPLDPGADGRWFEPDGYERPQVELQPIPAAAELVPNAPPFPLWTLFALAGGVAVSLAWHVVNLLGGP